MMFVPALAAKRPPQGRAGVADQHHRATAARCAVTGAGMESAPAEQAGGGNGRFDGLQGGPFAGLSARRGRNNPGVMLPGCS